MMLNAMHGISKNTKQKYYYYTPHGLYTSAIEYLQSRSWKGLEQLLREGNMARAVEGETKTATLSILS